MPKKTIEKIMIEIKREDFYRLFWKRVYSFPEYLRKQCYQADNIFELGVKGGRQTKLSEYLK